MTHFILDCDDVLLDWQGSFMRFWSAHGITLNPAGPQTWDLSKWIGSSPEFAAEMVLRFNESDEFGRLEALPGVVSVVRSMRDQGHKVSVVTCCGRERKLRSARILNLWNCFGVSTVLDSRADREHHLLMFDSVTFLDLGASKFDTLFQIAIKTPECVFVDDNFKHAQAGHRSGMKSYCVRRSHNRADEAANPDSGVMWIDHLSEVLHYDGRSQ